MFNLDVLDVAIGLSFVYLVLSLVMSTIRESIEGMVKSRSRFLEQAIGELLGDDSVRRRPWRRRVFAAFIRYRLRIREYRTRHPRWREAPAALFYPLVQSAAFRLKTGWNRFWKGRSANPDSPVARFYRHPLISGLYRGDYQPRGGNLPSYIPSGAFAQAVIDSGAVPDVVRIASGAATAKANAAQAVVAATPPDAVAPPSSAAAVNTDASIQSQVQTWYEGAMDRVSGWYRRETQLILFVIGVIMAVFLNIDSIGLIQSFKETGTMHDTVVARARDIPRPDPGQAALSPAAAFAEVKQLDLPIGWDSKGMFRFKQTLGIAPCEPPAKPGAAPSATGPQPTAAALAARVTCTPMQAITQQSLTDDFERVKNRCLDAFRRRNWDGVAASDAKALASAQAARDADGPGARSADIDAHDQALRAAAARQDSDERVRTRERLACLAPSMWTKLTLEARYSDPRGWMQLLTGWMITAFALTLGAPFWFDTLNKLIVIRSTVKPDEKGQEVASKDGGKK